MTGVGLEPNIICVKGRCTILYTNPPERGVSLYQRVGNPKNMKRKMKHGSFQVVNSTTVKVFISLDFELRLSLTSQLEGEFMLASNGTPKPLPKCRQGFEPCFSLYVDERHVETITHNNPYTCFQSQSGSHLIQPTPFQDLLLLVLAFLFGKSCSFTGLLLELRGLSMHHFIHHLRLVN